MKKVIIHESLSDERFPIRIVYLEDEKVVQIDTVKVINAAQSKAIKEFITGA